LILSLITITCHLFRRACKVAKTEY